ncbi:MAG: hypothetical protein WCE21_03640 [Candidatus Babeliales bacterium]
MKITSTRIAFFCLLTAGLYAKEISAQSDYQQIKDFMRAVNTGMLGTFYTDAMKESINRLHPNCAQALLADAIKEKNSLKNTIAADNFKQDCLDVAGVSVVTAGAGITLFGVIPSIYPDNNHLATALASALISMTIGIIGALFLEKHDQLVHEISANQERLKFYVALEEKLQQHNS